MAAAAAVEAARALDRVREVEALLASHIADNGAADLAEVAPLVEAVSTMLSALVEAGATHGHFWVDHCAAAGCARHGHIGSIPMCISLLNECRQCRSAGGRLA
jgi:hypothetical protein